MISKVGGAWYTVIHVSNIKTVRSSFSACAHFCEALNDFGVIYQWKDIYFTNENCQELWLLHDLELHVRVV